MAEELRRRVLERAAMARINERCALAYQHDVRGTLQAVYSTVELLKRTLAAQAPDPARIKKVSELASSALLRHEESTLAMLDTLTLHHLSPTALDLGALADAVGRFLRNEAASRQISIAVHESSGVTVTVAANTFRNLLTGLMLLAIDATPTGGEVVVKVRERLAMATVEIVGSGSRPSNESATAHPEDLAEPADLTLRYATHYLEARGGGLAVDTTPSGSRLLLSYPSLAASRDSAIAR